MAEKAFRMVGGNRSVGILDSPHVRRDSMKPSTASLATRQHHVLCNGAIVQGSTLARSRPQEGG
jgi:hypothetical protein